MTGFGFDAQSFIDAYSMADCLRCDGEGMIVVDGVLYDVTCPDCDGTGYQDGAA